MSPWRPQLIPFLGHLVRRKSFLEQDGATAAELNWGNRANLTLPAGVELEWLGTSGFRLTADDHTVLIDPYVTRLGLGDIAWARAVPPSEQLEQRFVRHRADVILVGHSHFDHVLDVPGLARRDHARVYGSPSTATLMNLYGLGDLATTVEAYRTYQVGPFEFSFTPSTHSRLMLGLSVPFDGDISCEHLDELAPSAYNCGQVYGISIKVAGVHFYHQGSADLIDDALQVRNVDYFLAGIAGRGFAERYVERILTRLEPAVVIPHHFDNFFRPLAEPMEFSLNVDLTGFVEDVNRVSSNFDVVTLRPLQSSP